MHALTALRHPNFAWFIGGQLFALVGYWVQHIAITWLIYRLTGSATLLGVLSLASNLPVLLLAPVAGLWSDRVDRHKLMLATQVLEMLQAVILAALALSGLIEVWHVIALAAVLGVLVAIELPVRHAYLLELVGERAEISKAVAVTSLMANCGRLAGPAVGGLLIGWLGEGACFAINAASFIAVLVSFIFIRPHRVPRAPSHPTLLRGLAEGLAYAWHTAPIRALLAAVAVVSLVAAPYSTLMPVVVKEVFGAGADLLGFLMAAAGLGAVSGTLFIAARKSVRGLTRIIAVAMTSTGAALAGLALSREVWLSLALMVVVGFSLLAITVSTNMILQTIVEDDKRGRVMSFYTTAFLGFVPIGALVAGAASDLVGPTPTLAAGGCLCLAAAARLWRYLPQLRGHVRPIYDRLGITP